MLVFEQSPSPGRLPTILRVLPGAKDEVGTTEQAAPRHRKGRSVAEDCQEREHQLLPKDAACMAYPPVGADHTRARDQGEGYPQLALQHRTTRTANLYAIRVDGAGEAAAHPGLSHTDAPRPTP